MRPGSGPCHPADRLEDRVPPAWLPSRVRCSRKKRRRWPACRRSGRTRAISAGACRIPLQGAVALTISLNSCRCYDLQVRRILQLWRLLTHVCIHATLPRVQVWTKLAIGFTATAIVIVSLYGAVQLVAEQRDLRAAAERDLRLTGVALRIAAGNALRDRQPSDVRIVVDTVKLRDPSLDVLVFDGAGGLIAGSWGSSAAEELVRHSIHDAQTTANAVVRFERPRGLSYAIGAFPIRDRDGVNIGALALVRPRDEARRDLTAEMRSTIL